MRRGASGRLVGVLLVATLSIGCFEKAFVHNPPLRANVQSIVKGKTTRVEVISRLGVPDIESDGINSKVNAGTPLARWWGDYLRAEPGWADALPYSSIDTDHEVMFYVEFLAGGALAPAGGKAPTLPQLTKMGFGVYRGNLSKNRLMVVISKKTGLVEEIAYREEFRRD